MKYLSWHEIGKIKQVKWASATGQQQPYHVDNDHIDDQLVNNQHWMLLTLNGQQWPYHADNEQVDNPPIDNQPVDNQPVNLLYVDNQHWMLLTKMLKTNSTLSTSTY